MEEESGNSREDLAFVEIRYTELFDQVKGVYWKFCEVIVDFVNWLHESGLDMAVFIFLLFDLLNVFQRHLITRWQFGICDFLAFHGTVGAALGRLLAGVSRLAVFKTGVANFAFIKDRLIKFH